MLLDEDDLIKVLKSVRQVIEDLKVYTINGHSPPVSVEDTQTVISRISGLKIEKFDVAVRAGQNVRGSMVRSGDSVKVLIDANLSKSVKKFISVKEFCHLVIDSPNEFSTDPHKTIEALLKTYELDKSANGDHEVREKVVISEIMAEIAALEILYPAELRENDKITLVNRDTTLATLELYYEVPKIYIARALSDRYQGITDLALSIYAEGTRQIS